MPSSIIKNKKATTEVKPVKANSNNASQRLEVLKTYKLYIGGQFPRTESGRYYVATNNAKENLGNICQASRKDFREAVLAARGAQKSWAAKAANNRGQIIYRIAEMLEGRRQQFIDELIKQDGPEKNAGDEVDLSIDRLIYYAGWCDKYQQIFTAVNPVASSHFNFSNTEPTGVVAAIAPQQNSLLGLVSIIAPVIAGGNTIIILASEAKPLCAIDFAEVINSSDVPGGVVNILTGSPKELATLMANHMDVNAVILSDADAVLQKEIQQQAAVNVKRVVLYESLDWFGNAGQSPYFINDFQEIKTTWHPIEDIGGGKSGY